MKERYLLSMERIREIQNDNTTKEPFLTYFRDVASFIGVIEELVIEVESGAITTWGLASLAELNKRLYSDVLPQNYEQSYANPKTAVERLGEEIGELLSFLYTQIRGEIPFAFEGRIEDITILNELFLQIYSSFETESQENAVPSAEQIRENLYYHVSDYCDVTVRRRVQEQLDPDFDFATRLIMDSDLKDIRYLYLFGEYITDNEVKTAEYLNSLPMADIIAMAKTYTEGYRIGFINTGKDLSKKRVVNIRYSLGFERIVRQAILNFEEMGLKPVIYRAAVHAATKIGNHKIGYFGASPNKQYEYDHKEDDAIFFDKAFVGRKLEILRMAYEEFHELASVHAGPAVMEVFGETPFIPSRNPKSYALSEKQQKLYVEYESEAAAIVNEFIKGEERSFTIIAYPIPEIGEDYQEIFSETVKVNTLDYKEYESMQQEMIDILDKGSYVEIRGCGDNHTELCVSLIRIADGEKQTKFENCVADVNIPVGEVFTTPVLKGTTGRLCVSEVYLGDLRFENLELDFTDGYVTDYICSNFEKDEDNRKYIRDNVLFHHETLPMGEFAIGTNTTAYAMAKKYRIFSRLPILIAEKTGPHFAVGDTCYSHAEDISVYNPNGKEIMARDNEVSIKRKEGSKSAYFNCHTDITIPYEELGEVTVVSEDGTRYPMIKNGKFVPEKCAKLNEPLENTTLTK